MTIQLDDLTLGGAITQDTDGYWSQLSIGQVAASFSHATGAQSCGVLGVLEVQGVSYVRDLSFADAASDILLKDNDANALTIAEGSNAYMNFDTTDGAELIEVSKIMEMGVDGFTNEGGGTGTIRQPETFRVALADADTVGGILDFTNPWAATAFVEDLVVYLTTAATAACTADAGVSNGAASDDTIMDALDLNAATGTFSMRGQAIYIAEGGGASCGNASPEPITLASGNHVVISKATGAAAGTAGYAYIRLQLA